MSEDQTDLKQLSDDAVDIKHDLGKLQLRINGLEGGVMKAGLEQFGGHFERANKYMSFAQDSVLQVYSVLDKLSEEKNE